MNLNLQLNVGAAGIYCSLGAREGKRKGHNTAVIEHICHWCQICCKLDPSLSQTTYCAMQKFGKTQNVCCFC